MPSRDLPARPDLDHLKNEAKALRRAFVQGDAGALDRVRTVLGDRTSLKLTEAQRVIAREYGFDSWARLRARVQAARGIGEAVAAFLAAAENRDTDRALAVLRAEPRIATASIHVAAVLGLDGEVRRHLAEDATRIHARTGSFGGDPMLWLCYSPFHGENPDRDAALAATMRTLLEAGADPNTRDRQHGVPALYALTGVNNAPAIARILLDAGANPTDGESVFHAAEKFHVESLELLLSYGADLNASGEWGNTPLYFLLRHWEIATQPRVRQGIQWLLDHGADPNVRCARERETSLHAAARRGQHPDVVRLLLEHGADPNAVRGDGRTPWSLARRGGHDEIAALLESFGATPVALSPADELLAACGRGDADQARRLASPERLASLDDEGRQLLPSAAASGRTHTVIACIAAGFPVDTKDEYGATALHHATIHGHAEVVRELLRRRADFTIRDNEHDSTPLGWACFGADFVKEPGGDYEEAVRALLEAGARPGPHDRPPEHAGVRAVLTTSAGQALGSPPM